MEDRDADSAGGARRRLALVGRAAALARPFRRLVGAVLALTLLGSGLAAVEPLLFKQIFDGLTGERVRSVWLAVAGLAALGLVRESAGGISNWLTWRVRLRLHQELLERTVEKLHRMPLDLRASEGVGAVLTRLDRSIQGFLEAVSRVLFEVLPAAVFLVLAVVFMLRLDVRLALVVALFVPAVPLLGLVAAPEQIRRERSLLDRWAGIYSRFNEVLSGLATVRSFAMEDAEKRRFMDRVREANRLVVRGVALDTGFGAGANLVVVGARVVAVGLGAAMVLRGEISVGTLVAFIGYLAGLFGPVQGLTQVFQSVHKATVSLEEIFRILDLQDRLGDAPDAAELERPVGRVAFQRVRFAYPGMTRPVLVDVDLEVEAGEHVALVGPSGSGKSTLMALLMRFYDPLEGTVRIDGRDLRRVKQDSLRRQIGVVLQDAVLFQDSLRENIAYGRPGASLGAIEAAARAACADGFIRRLPEGYDTSVGERGARLSPGERQRVALARAFLKDPRILILDEPTASLDPETEAELQEALERVTAGRTVFTIAHRLETVVRCDRIVVLQGGRIVETGSHAGLLRRGGIYASMVRQQVGGLLDPAR